MSSRCGGSVRPLSGPSHNIVAVDVAERSKRKKGRETKLTDELIADISKSIEAGCYAIAAIRAANIDPKTYYNWLAWGEEGREPYVHFFHAINQADGKAEVEASKRFSMLAQHSMPNSPQALVSFMERRWPERWSRGERREVTGQNGNPIAVTVAVTGARDDGADG